MADVLTGGMYGRKPVDNTTYAGVKAPAGYEFGTADPSKQMWAGNQLVAFRPLVSLMQGVFGDNPTTTGNPVFDKIRAAYGLPPLRNPSPSEAATRMSGNLILRALQRPVLSATAAPAPPLPAPPIEGGAAILAGPTQQELARRSTQSSTSQGVFRPTAVAAPMTASKMLLGG